MAFGGGGQSRRLRGTVTGGTVMKPGILLGGLLALVMTGTAANADPVTFSTYLKDPVWAKQLDAMFGKTPKPDWLRNATESEAVPVTMDGRPYTVLLACRKHDCANHQLAVLFDKTAIYGLRFETRDNSPKEELTWFNIGGGPESIDGKTILYAAITGSLFNHPGMFSFPAGK
ncbi:Ivy family c-type lysozyme inhibitor [Gluconacetobacter entanii]|uniref:Ivy family c-type lysozyme inhibitor n=2 Tax=Gluconacetobacter entanii TaxID=108528 RepID=A0ABT3K7H5_9PROT|nr:Ivy family c-type lysozyme inhibitor [Gluconacetobacter entanii]MBE7619256.1 C-lysozyme inhibitor [Komagataeibacter sp. FXV2]MCW4591338.1 Ivy family c-type lysozyme inhibitor [Gluconacetobacter entanii]MCW4595579.1 Ivy family c-type lysozyme inhibitor [Gluconacetobacter entanii]